MTLKQYWMIAMKRWGLILFCVLAVGGGSYVGNQFAKRSYLSTVVVQIVTRKNTNIRFVQTEVQLATSAPVLQTVAAHYMGLTATDLVREVTAKALIAPAPRVKLFQITVVDQSSTRAAGLANDIAALLVEQFQTTSAKNLQSQQETQRNIASIRQQIDALMGQITALEAEKGSAANIGPLQAQIAILQGRQAQQQSTLTQLKLAQARNANSMAITLRAEPARTPIRPDLLRDTTTACLIGLFLGLLLVLMLEQWETRTGTVEALKQQLLVWSRHIAPDRQVP